MLEMAVIISRNDDCGGNSLQGVPPMSDGRVPSLKDCVCWDTKSAQRALRREIMLYSKEAMKDNVLRLSVTSWKEEKNCRNLYNCTKPNMNNEVT